MDADPFIGLTIIQGRYVIEREIGRGAMGRVYEARSQSGRSVIAVKFLHPHLLAEPEILERFRRESRAAHSLPPSPFIARVLSSGAIDDKHAHYPYICFERLYGETLAERLHRVRALAIPSVIQIVDHVLQGLAVAHPTLIHRDIKPANLFLVQRAQGGDDAVILDFGVSKVHEDRALTKVQSTLGSIAYIAPEQMEDAARVTPAADLYAVGVIAFECLTGRLPFGGRNTVELQEYKRLRRARSLESQMREGWSGALPAIGDVLARLLSRRAADRYASAHEALMAWRVAAESTQAR